MHADIAAVLEGRAQWALVHADNSEVLPTLGERSVAHVITDPPYSEHVHSKQRMTPKRGMGNGRPAFGPIERSLGFESLSADVRRLASGCFAKATLRWVLIFSDPEGVGGWHQDLVASGLEHVRTGAWVKLGGQPQLTGDRPAAGFEAIEIAHQRGRKSWNGGGHAAVWTWPIVKTHAANSSRVHTTQKPLPLMLELVELFTDPGDVVLDPFAGSGTTGVACLRLGRRFVGIERDEKYAQVARERLAAEDRGLSLRDARAGQTSIFDAIGGGP